jgi:RNA polymerase sigma-70 factor (ECF subfamily)
MTQDGFYQEVLTVFGAALSRLARSYEADPEKRRDLLQDMHFGIWRSLMRFDRQCSLRTWVFRVAHNICASHVLKQRRSRDRLLVSLDDVHELPSSHDVTGPLHRQITLDHLYGLVHSLQAVDREVILLYLEGLDAASIGEITGISSGNVATKIHRIKKLLKQLTEGGRHGV